MSATKAICVWLDSVSDPTDPKWIVSRDTISLPGGEAVTTHTESVLSTEGEAMAEGRTLAERHGLPLYRNTEGGPAELIEGVYAAEIDGGKGGETTIRAADLSAALVAASEWAAAGEWRIDGDVTVSVRGPDGCATRSVAVAQSPLFAE